MKMADRKVYIYIYIYIYIYEKWTKVVQQIGLFFSGYLFIDYSQLIWNLGHFLEKGLFRKFLKDFLKRLDIL